MTRTQQQGLLLAGLVIVMVAVYARALQPSSGPSSEEALPEPPVVRAEPTASQPTASTVAPPPPRSPDVQQAQRDRTATLSWNRDPFVRGSAIGQMSGLMLSGILWDDAHPMAIINGTMVETGQELDGYHILEIGHDRVAVTDGTQTFDLQVAP